MKPGQKVVCIKTSEEKEVIKGEIYTIEDIGCADDNSVYLDLYEVKPMQSSPRTYYIGFNITLFRLVDYTFGEIIAEFIEEIVLEES